MKRRSILNLLMAGGCTVAVACVDLSAPSGPAAISELVLPATFVVRGDVMRDSLGNPAPPEILAFDQKGVTTIASGASFFMTDSIKHAHFDNGIIAGDSIGTAHVVGQTGSLQTSVYALPVTVAPVILQRLPVTDTTDTIRAVVAADSATSRQSYKPFAIPLRVAGGANAPSQIFADTGVQGVWVTYEWVHRPANRDSAHTAAFIVNQAGDVSMIDTTDASGKTKNQIIVIGSFLDTAVLAGHRADSVVIKATAFYTGKPGSTPLQKSPVVLIFPLKPTFNVK